MNFEAAAVYGVVTRDNVFRAFVGVAVVVFGIQQIVLGEFVTRLIPALPGGILAYLLGALLLVVGVGIVVGKRVAALALAGIGLLSFLFLDVPRLVPDLHNGGLWTQSGKAVAFAGAGLILAGVSWGRVLLAAFLILAGVQHFIYGPFVAQLVPSWIPGQLFWAYFAGVALIAGGAGMIVPRTMRLAALSVGIMILSWVFLLHVPRALTIQDANELTAVFEALAFSGAALLVK